MANSGWFPGKASSHSTALPNFSPLCAVFSFFHTTGCDAYSFTTDGYGIFNVSITDLGACRTHEGGRGRGGGGSGTNKSAHELTRKDRNCTSPCPAMGSNPGSSDLNSDSLTTELRPWFVPEKNVSYNRTLLLWPVPHKSYSLVRLDARCHVTLALWLWNAKPSFSADK